MSNFNGFSSMPRAFVNTNDNTGFYNFCALPCFSVFKKTIKRLHLYVLNEVCSCHMRVCARKNKPLCVWELMVTHTFKCGPWKGWGRTRFGVSLSMTVYFFILFLICLLLHLFIIQTEVKQLYHRHQFQEDRLRQIQVMLKGSNFATKP